MRQAMFSMPPRLRMNSRTHGEGSSAFTASSTSSQVLWADGRHVYHQHIRQLSQLCGVLGLCPQALQLVCGSSL